MTNAVDKVLLDMAHSLSGWNKQFQQSEICQIAHCAARRLSNRGGEILTGKKKPLWSCCFPSRELETLVLSRQSLRTKQWCSPSYILPHCRTNPVLIAPMSDLVWIQPRVRWCQKKSQGINKVCRLSGCPEWQNKILCNSIKLISEILCEAQISHCLLTYSVSQCVRPWIKLTPEYPFKVFWVQRHMLVNVAGLQWLNLANL